MKKLLLILLCLPIMTLAQQTYVPDDNFEAYLENNGMGNGIPNDDYVFTAAIDTVAYLDLSNKNISDLTGIEAFDSLLTLFCYSNQFSDLNLSNNLALFELDCSFNFQLDNLNVKNGNNHNFNWFDATENQNLSCIEVDDSTWSANNWTVTNGNIDLQHYFSNNCSGTTSIEEYSTNKKLLQTIDVLGRETKNKPLFYIYDDGTVEKRITIE